MKNSDEKAEEQDVNLEDETQAVPLGPETQASIILSEN